MFKGPQGMLLAGNAAAAFAADTAAPAADDASAADAATSAATTAADKTKMCAYGLIWPEGLPNGQLVTRT